jgi:hypothetical protein
MAGMDKANNVATNVSIANAANTHLNAAMTTVRESAGPVPDSLALNKACTRADDPGV